MTPLQAMKQAMVELCTQRDAHYSGDYPTELREAITNLRAAIEQMENVKPVAWFCEDESTLSFAKMRGCDCIPLYHAHAVPESRYLDEETYTLQLKEAWESGFRCGLREARPEETK